MNPDLRAWHDPVVDGALWPVVTARIVRGHRVASGLNGNPRFPGGTLRMQQPHFLALGFDLAAYHPGTLNISIAPCRYRVVQAPITFRNVKWHPTDPAEDFSLFDMHLLRAGAVVVGKIYYPHPETKPTHFQTADVLELILPFVEGLNYGDTVRLAIPPEQMVIEPGDMPPGA